MNITIRLEQEKDFREVENVTREAFWDIYRSGCVEHLIVHKMRKSNVFVKELDFVACLDSKIVGNIIYSKAKVISENNEEYEVLCMGPISVLPQYQNEGIGTMLMNHSVEIAKSKGYNAVVIFGDPKYYYRFGFENAKKFNIKTSQGENFDEFMALELYEGAFNGISGRFQIDPVFEVGEDELKSFEKHFPHKDNNFKNT